MIRSSLLTIALWISLLADTIGLPARTDADRSFRWELSSAVIDGALDGQSEGEF